MKLLAEVEAVLDSFRMSKVCIMCGEHWLKHSFHGDFCPDTNGIRRLPKTTFTEYMPGGPVQ